MPSKSDIGMNVFVTKVASLSAQGMGMHKIAALISEETGEKVTWSKVRRALETQQCKDIVREINEVAVETAVAIAKSGLSKLAKKAVEVVSANLEDDNLNAAVVVFKSLGIDQQDSSPKGQQNITVVLPGVAEKPAQEIQIEEIKDNSNDVETRNSEDS
jgi:hypothetical protein